MLSTVSIADVTAGQAVLYGFLGYAVVFFGLILLMLVVILIGKAFMAKTKKTAATPETSASEAPAPKAAPGTAGQLKLHNVDPKTAAMLMAITADKMGKPINQLRFISIREVDQ